MKPEAIIKALVKKLLNQYPCWWTMTIPSAYGGSTGVPDYTCVYKGKAFFIETKAPGKVPTALQDRQMNAIRAAGGKCFVVDGEASLELVRLWLQEEK